MKVCFIYRNYFDFNGEKVTIGGIQTYISHLSNLCVEMGIQPYLVQCANKEFFRKEKELHVFGILPRRKEIKKDLFDAALKLIDPISDILIFVENHLAVKNDLKKCLSIQHGISWDLPARFMTNRKILMHGIGGWLTKFRASYTAFKSIDYVKFVVCVDYNFLNWYKTITPYSDSISNKIWIIPNSTNIASLDEIERKFIRTSDNHINIIFARRFTEYRGIKMIAEVAKKVFETTKKEVHFTFAGEGPEQTWLEREFLGEERVKIINFSSENTLNIHLKYHIAIVPSIASEGTSYSVSEAMAAGCAVVATSVGGVANMIISGYNGLLTMPDSLSLYNAVTTLINDDGLREEIGKRAYDTASKAFSLDKWKESWRAVLNEVSSE